MMTVVDARHVISSLFIMLKEDIYVLMRIEILVALVTAMFMVMFIMDFYRCRSRSSIVITALKTIDGLSDQIVVYLIGVMQSADFKNDLFPVWAIVLVSLRASLGYLSGYGIPDRERRLHEVANVTKFLGVGLLTGTRGLVFTKPLWSMWAILLLRSLYRFFAVHKAIDSLWHGRSSEFLPEYMGTLRQPDCEENSSGNGNGTRSIDPDKDHKYLIYGESRQKMEVKKPGYTLHLDVTDRNSLITLDKVLECPGNLLTSDNKYKDISVAFTLSRLLRCRLEDVTLHRESVLRTQHLITSETNSALHMDDAERAFRILELELAFVRDYFYTLYPMVFWQGLVSLCFSLLLSMATFGVAFWLAIGIRKVYRPTEETLVLMAGSCNVDVVITWVFIFFMMFKEVWEVVTYLLSNWTRLLLVSSYVKKPKAFMEDFIRSIFKSKIADPWHRRIDQYDLLNSYTYKPSFWKLANVLSMGKVPTKIDGKKRGEAIKIPPCVKPAIMCALRRMDLKSLQLPARIPSLTLSSVDQFNRYSWACFKLHTCSQVILVWHIATSLCEIKLAQDHGTTSPGILRSALSSLLSCCTSQPQLVDKKSDLSGTLETNYHIANSLSRYCAYLQVFQPGLLPDSFVVPEVIFNETVEHARKQLTDCSLLIHSYKKLMVMEVAEDSVDARLRMNIIQQGASLGNDLIKYENEESRWMILAGVWADLLVHIAPSWNAAEHKNSLEAGGELITLIWALLWHCGIEKSSLWDKDETPEGSPQAPRQNNYTETSRVHPMMQDQPNEEISESFEERQTSSTGRDGNTEMLR
ncbi:unnamed protein product [Alopecurus aequalis]